MSDNEDKPKGENILNSKNQQLSPLEIVEVCARAGDSKKARDILVLDVGSIISVTDYFVILSGSSDRQVKAISDFILSSTRDLSIKPISTEGYRQSEWVLIDFGSVVVHVFVQEARNFYRIERLFKDAERIDWNQPRSAVG